MHLALTGGIGSGKSTVLNFFSQLGVPTFSADKKARTVMEENEKIKIKIINLFGTDAYINNFLNTDLISGIIFKDSKKLHELNSIVHPSVISSYNQWKKNQDFKYTLYESAVVLEQNHKSFFDGVILVTAPYIEKIKRLTRKKYTKKRINDVMKNQWKDSIKIPLTNYVIENIDLEKTKLQVVNLHNQFMLRN